MEFNKGCKVSYSIRKVGLTICLGLVYMSQHPSNVNAMIKPSKNIIRKLEDEKSVQDSTVISKDVSNESKPKIDAEPIVNADSAKKDENIPLTPATLDAPAEKASNETDIENAKKSEDLSKPAENP